MKIYHYCITLILFINFSSCKKSGIDKKSTTITKNISSELDVDHFNIWVKNPTLVKEKLIAIGFTAVPDSLSAIHHGQGTSGKYFNFLNTYLELIFVYDQKELEENNRNNKALDFTERANFDKNDASPFSIALKVKDYEIDKIPFEKVKYYQDWMEENGSIFAAKSSKTHLKEPSIFVVYPKIEYPTYESISFLENVPSENPFWKDFFKHPNGAKKVTNISIASKEINVNTNTIKAVNSIKNVTVKSGNEHLMELYFDDNSQGKKFDLRPELPLIIYI